MCGAVYDGEARGREEKKIERSSSQVQVSEILTQSFSDQLKKMSHDNFMLYA